MSTGNMSEKDKYITKSTAQIGIKRTKAQVNVSVRCRPTLSADIAPVDHNDSNNDVRVVEVNEPEGQVIVTLEKPKTFQFDTAFDGNCGQHTVYSKSVSPLVQRFIYDCDNAR